MSFKRLIPFTRQPQYPVKVDAANPANSKLVFVWNAAQKKRELVNGVEANTDNTAAVGSVAGLAADCSLAQVNIEWAREFCKTSDGVGTGDFSFVVVANPASVGAVQHVLEQKNDAAGAPYAQAGLYANTSAAFDSAAGNFAFNLFNSTTTGVTAAGQCDGNWHTWVGTRRGTTLSLYRDGKLQATAAFTVISILQAATRYTAIGSRGNGTTEGYPDNASFAAMCDRALSDQEIERFYSNPLTSHWQIFEPLKRNIYVEAAAGGVTAALTGQAVGTALGSFGATVTAPLVGQSVASVLGVLSPAVVGAITGQSASLTIGSLVGAVAPALTGHAITSAQGTVVVEGGVIAAITGHAVGTALGNFSAAITSPLTGQSITLSQGTVVPALSWAITGQPVSLSIGSLVGAISPALSGQSAALIQGAVVVDGAVVTSLLSTPRRLYSNTQTASRSNTQTASRSNTQTATRPKA